MNFIKKHLKGFILSLVIAIIALLINKILPIDIIGTALIALVLGMVLNPLIKNDKYQEKINFTSKYILRIGIILAGITLSFNQVFEVGKYALILLTAIFITSFTIGYIFHKTLNINWRLTSLLSVSQAICGGTAVATLGPVIEAKDHEIAFAISSTFIFDLLTVILFPVIGVLLNMTDQTFGLWVGTSINDTSSVVAAGYAFSEISGALATIVKLTRTLFIVPIVLVFSYINIKSNLKTNKEYKQKKVKLRSIFPWFILGFILFTGIRSLNILTAETIDFISELSKFLMATALAAIGLKTSFKQVKGVGIKPMITTLTINLAAALVSLIILYIML